MLTNLKPKETNKKKTKYIALSTFLLILILSLSVYIVLNRSSDSLVSDSSTPPAGQQVSMAPTSTPKPLPEGKQVYNYSHGKDVAGPKPTRVIIDPIDPNLGDTQTLTVSISHEKPIINASAVLITDNQSVEVDLEEESDNSYKANFKVKDTYNYTYKVSLIFSDDLETFTGTLTFR